MIPFLMSFRVLSVVVHIRRLWGTLSFSIKVQFLHIVLCLVGLQCLQSFLRVTEITLF